MSDSADRSQAFLDSTEDAVFVIEAETRIVADANARAILETGYPLEEIVGLAIDRLFLQTEQAPPLFGDPGGIEPAGGGRHSALLARKNGEALRVDVSSVRFRLKQASYVVLIAAEAKGATACGDVRDMALPEREEFPTIIGRSVKIRDVCRRIGSLANSDVTVLLQGESGTGKEIIANAVHAHSYRGRSPFVKVNCAAITETLFESELFGHVKGAFTGAIRDRCGRFKQADGGTIFLDEIGSMALAGQAKLLRVLQEREFEPVGSSVTTSVNVRVIAATNSDLAKAVTEGRFREDLYYRLNVFPIFVPALRERKEDVELLGLHFLQIHNRISGKQRKFTPEAMTLLIEHDWPGNVRELENAVEHAVIVENGSSISPDSLPMNLKKSRETYGATALSMAPVLRDKLNAFERQVLIDALACANGVKKQAAAMLGIDARNLPYLLRKHHLNEGSSSNVNLH